MSYEDVRKKFKDKIFTASGAFFENPKIHRSLFFRVLTSLIETRKKYKKLRSIDKDNYMTYDNYQRSVKENTNSVYGVLGFNAFRFFNPDLVNSVTLTGQFMIKFASILYSQMIVSKKPHLTRNQIINATRRVLDMYLTNDVKEPYVLYSDTDSVDGNTMINCDLGEMPIAELYDKAPGTSVNIGPKSFMKTVYLSVYTKSFDVQSRKVEEAEIKRIKKHYVTKGIYRVLPVKSEKGVIVTEDHSVDVLRGTTIIPVRPEDIKHGDRLIIIKGNTYQTKPLSVKFLGKQSRWVYDIEVDNDSHTFVGNDILVHNSVFLDIDNKVDKKFMDDATEFINKKSFKVLGDEFFGFKDIYMALDYKGLYRSYFTDTKKKYALYNLEEKKMEITGLDIVRSDYPKLTRERLHKVIKMLLEENSDLKSIMNLVEEYRNDFVKRIKNLDLSVGRPMPYNKPYKKYKKVPSHVFSMELWNRIVKSNTFRPGSKGYVFKGTIDINKLSEAQKKKLNDLSNEVKRKSSVTSVVIPLDFKGQLPEFININIESNLNFIWNDRINYLLSGIVKVQKEKAVSFSI